MLDWESFKRLGLAQVGKPYLYGAVADVTCPDPVAFDCAELVYWLYGRALNVRLSNYSDGQFRQSIPADNPRLGDLGFWRKGNSPTHHVGILWDDGQVLEARGDNYGKVIFRPRKSWEAWKDFTGWRRPLPVIQKERS